jgi:hypothetical protein
MPIKISKTLIGALPVADRPGIEARLREKSKGHCYLCRDEFNWATDSIEADHDDPGAEGGPTTLDNLNLAHVECNRAKRNAKTVDIRPYLQLRAYLRREGPLLKYDGIQPHFGIKPKPSVIDRDGNQLTLHLPGRPAGGVTVPIYGETNRLGSFEFVFADLPREAIFNDDNVQPRTIKEGHAWRIYSDLQHNPLNEPPSARLESSEGTSRILLFDGQHKTVASWMMGRQSVVAKVYLALTEAEARRLVNSVQSAVPKLPLSPFELAAKMEEEWQDRLEAYEVAVGADEASEAGFFGWLPVIDRARAKAAFREAIIQGQLSNPDLGLRDFVKRPGEKPGVDGLAITEATLKNKVLARLVRLEPLDLKGDAMAAYRAVEQENVVFLLESLVDQALTPDAGEQDLSPARSSAARRMLYQSALTYITVLMTKAFTHFTMVDALGKTRLTELQKGQLREGVRRIVNHPVWSEPYSRDRFMEAVKNALDKNQEARQAFENVALDLSYVVLGDEAPQYKKYWREQVLS